MIREYIQYAVWNGLACQCRCVWTTEVQSWFLHSFIDLMGHGSVSVHFEASNGAVTAEYGLEIREEKFFSLNVKSHIIYLTMQRDQLIGTEAIQCLLTVIFQYEHKKRGLLSLHSGAYRFENKTVLLAGESGAGKTTLLLNAQKRIRGFEMLSNDFVVIRMEKTPMLIYTDASSSISIRTDIFRGQMDGEEPAEFSGSENRRYFKWRGQEIESLCPVDTIVFPELVASFEKLHIRKMGKDEAFYRLYYSATSLDLGLHLMLFDVNGELLSAIPCLTDEDLLIKTREAIQSLVMYAPIFRVNGTLEQIISFIEKPWIYGVLT